MSSRLVSGNQLIHLQEWCSRTVLALDTRDIGDLLHIQERSNPGQNVLPESTVRSNDVRDPLLLDILNEQRRIVLRKILTHR